MLERGFTSISWDIIWYHPYNISMLDHNCISMVSSWDLRAIIRPPTASRNLRNRRMEKSTVLLQSSNTLETRVPKGEAQLLHAHICESLTSGTLEFEWIRAMTMDFQWFPQAHDMLWSELRCSSRKLALQSQEPAMLMAFCVSISWRLSKYSNCRGFIVWLNHMGTVPYCSIIITT